MSQQRAGWPAFDSTSSFTEEELDNLPPLKDWPPPEILERWAERRELYRRQRRRRRMLTAGIVILALAGGGLYVSTRGSSPGPKAPAIIVAPTTGTVAWSVTTQTGELVAVVSAAHDLGPVALAIPGDTLVDIPGGGPATVGAAGTTSGVFLAAVQAAMDRPVDHFLMSDGSDLAALIDLVGPIDVETDSVFSYQGLPLGPGPERLSGAAVLEYLDQALVDERTGRWEEVLAGLFGAKLDAPSLQLTLGLTDSDAVVKNLFLAAKGAIVLELPTAPNDTGGLEVDAVATEQLLQRQFGPAGAPLVRVVVLIGNGRPAAALRVATILSGAGFRVVASQEAASDSVDLTQIVASSDDLVPKGEEVRGLLAVGTVYVGTQPTGVADITIVVGKDFPKD